MTLTVSNNSAVLLTAGGIHYELNRVRPNVYTGGNWIKIVANLSVRPKRLTISNDELQLGGDGALSLPVNLDQVYLFRRSTFAAMPGMNRTL